MQFVVVLSGKIDSIHYVLLISWYAKIYTNLLKHKIF
jgi:hypothetical protein